MLKRISVVTLLLFAVGAFAAETAGTQKVDDLDTLIQNMETGSGMQQPNATPVPESATAPEPSLSSEPAPVPEPAPAPEPAVAKAPEPAPAPAPEPAVAKAPEPTPEPTPAPEPAPALASEPAPTPPIPVTAPAPVPVAQETPAAVPAASKEELPTYHYAYVPDESLEHELDYGKVSQAGHPGLFFMSFLGQGVFYKDYNKGVPGFGVETGFQFNLFKYMSLAAAFNAAYRRGFIAGDKFYPFGALGQLRLRVLPWLYPFFEGGIECIKIARAGWQPRSEVLGGGLMIRMGAADKKAEYNIYKAVRITRMMLILAFDHIKVSGNKSIMPDAYIFKGGASIEF